MSRNGTGTALSRWEPGFREFIAARVAETGDAAHDLAHVQRVVANARQLGGTEGACMEVVIPAAWLHDCVIVPKDSPRRRQASRLSAVMAREYLAAECYPAQWIDPIAHAIEAHSFSAGLTPETLEARVVQDADRLDALGAVGIARTLMLGGAMGSDLYHPGEPFPVDRAPDDRRYAVDHFYTKLLGLADTMQTDAGRSEARSRTKFMQTWLDQLARETGSTDDPVQATPEMIHDGQDQPKKP